MTINGDGQVDGVSSNEQGYHMAIWANGGHVEINGGTFTNANVDGDDTQYDLIYASNGGTVVINGGTFISKTPRWTLNVKNGSNTSWIKVEGGIFYEFDPSAAYTDDDIPEGGKNPVNYVVENSLVEFDGESYYTVTSSIEEN